MLSNPSGLTHRSQVTEVKSSQVAVLGPRYPISHTQSPPRSALASPVDPSSGPVSLGVDEIGAVYTHPPATLI